MKNREGTKPVSDKLKKNKHCNQQFSAYKTASGKRLSAVDGSNDQDDERVFIRSTN